MTASPLVAPSDDASVLAYPRFSAAPALIERNRASLSSSTSVFGLPLARLRRDAIAGALAAARSYMTAAGDPTPNVSGDSLIVCGHQPDLFHPGVWVKNFAIARLARSNGAAAMNLLTDNDVLKRSSIDVPITAGDPHQVRHAVVPFDDIDSEMPLEDRTIRDETVFTAFPARVRELTEDWPATPIAERFWAGVQERRPRTSVVGALFAGARRACERRWGCHNWEVPLSKLATTPAFAELTLAILRATPAVHDSYNSALRGYRKRRGMRNAFHPAPDLARDGDWWEAPFWARCAESSRRERLFVRADGDQLQFRAGRIEGPSIAREADFETLQKLERDGFRIRTRALMTTLMTRLLLADLFVHGIGGGKYDEATDDIIARLCGFEPPAYLVVTGTLRLPLAPFPASDDDWRTAQRELRDLRWNPQRMLGGDWRTRHAKLIEANGATRTERRIRSRQLRDLNAAMQPLVAKEFDKSLAHERHLADEVRANAILRRRDYSFVLHSEEKLRAFLTQF